MGGIYQFIKIFYDYILKIYNMLQLIQVIRFVKLM